MKFNQAIDKLGSEEARKLAKAAAETCKLRWDDGIGVIFEVCVKDRDRQPNMGLRMDDSNAAIGRWVKRYKQGYDGRPSRSTGKPTHTVPDEIIDEILSARLINLSKDQVKTIKYAHRLSMSAENILGAYLEEYLATKLKEHGWYCAWGNTLKSVDMCHTSGKLLQIKNRSNTENSSSSTVRDGTDIIKWFRVDAISGRYAWAELQDITGAKNVSEEDFRKFVSEALKKNPGALAVEDENPWIRKS